jgi:hypothetical protein
VALPGEPENPEYEPAGGCTEIVTLDLKCTAFKRQIANLKKVKEREV